MDYLLLNKFISIFNNSASKKEIYASLYVTNDEELIVLLDDFINKNYIELLMVDNFYQSYKNFLYDLKEWNVDSSILVNHLVNNLKNITRDYNKNKIKKDIKYYKANAIINDYKNIKEVLNEKKEENTNIYNILYFVITKLKKPDYIFRLFELHPDYINLKNYKNESLFIDILNYYYINLNILSDDDIKYFKRIFVLFLENPNLNLNNKELIYILSTSENNLKGKSIKDKENVNFIITEIDNHYEIINQNSRLTSIDYIKRDCPVEIIIRNINTKRVDRTKDFIISIDNVRSNDLTNRLIDDTFSIKENSDQSYNIFMHIPDVDFYISKDSKTDIFARHIGESVYASGNLKSMLPNEIATLASLKHGIEKPALTFNIHVDKNGNILDIHFEKSIINVNYNFTKRDADIFINNHKDERLEMLKVLVKVCKKLRKKRGETIGKRSESLIIVDEINVLADIATALYFKENNLIFPYKNYKGKRSLYNSEHVNACEEFSSLNNLSSEEKNILYSIFDIENRVYYDTVSIGNKSYNGLDAGNVGNPLRSYISLETDRLIKDIVISKENNFPYWKERIERDIIEYTETSARIKTLYKKR